MTKDELDTLLDRDETLNEQDYSNVQDWISSNCNGFSDEEWNAYFYKLLNRFKKENNKTCADLIKKYVKELISKALDSYKKGLKLDISSEICDSLICYLDKKDGEEVEF